MIVSDKGSDIVLTWAELKELLVWCTEEGAPQTQLAQTPLPATFIIQVPTLLPVPTLCHHRLDPPYAKRCLAMG
jgi:hypothetical protein